MKQFLLALALLPALFACSSGGGSSTPTGTGGPPINDIVGIGSLTLTGIDTADLGTSMIAGDVAIILDANQEIKAITLVNAGSVIKDGDVFDYPTAPFEFQFMDPANFFIMTILDDEGTGNKGISLTFGVQSASAPQADLFAYGCTTPTGGFINCEINGALVVDKTAQTITFVDVSVSPGPTSEAKSVLTLNGVISWL